MQGNTYLHWFMIKDAGEDTDEQPDEDVHRARSERVPSAGVSVPVELGCVTLHQPRSSLKPILEELLWRLDH